MLRRRTFQRRGKDVELRELTDFIAVRPTESKFGNSFDARARLTEHLHSPELNFRPLQSMASEVFLPQLTAFENRGWVFVGKDQIASLPFEVQEAKVFIKPDGRLALSVNKLVVKLHDDPKKAEADLTLKPFGCQTLDRLSFAPGLFRVELHKSGPSDVLDVADQLVRSGVAEFAEPELIEALSER